MYYLGNNIVSNSKNDWIYKTPIPNKVIAEDEHSKKIYKEAGFRNIEIMDEVLRLNYLNRLKGKILIKIKY